MRDSGCQFPDASSSFMSRGLCLGVSSAEPAIPAPVCQTCLLPAQPLSRLTEEDSLEGAPPLYSHPVCSPEGGLRLVSLPRSGYKRKYGFSFGCPLSLPCSRETSCCAVNCPGVRPTWPRTDVWPTAMEARRPAHSNRSQCGSGSSHLEHGDGCSLSQHLGCSLRDPKPEAPS